LSAISVGTPARLPLSTSAFFTQSRRVCAVQPILAGTETIVATFQLGLVERNLTGQF
jgi:hypothetical protein